MTLSESTIRTAPAERLRVDAVILDLDGTLVDSNEAHARAWVEVLGREGFHLRLEDVRPLIGMGGDLLIEKLTRIGREDPRSRRLSDERKRVFAERWLGTVAPQPGARELVAKLHDRGFTLVVATSSAEDELRRLLAAVGVEELIDGYTTADDVEVAKPYPDVVHAALAKAGCNADHAVLIGDTPYDVAAAREAGVTVIALRCGGWDDASLDGAIEVFDDPADLLRNWMQTPFRASLADLDAPL